MFLPGSCETNDTIKEKSKRRGYVVPSDWYRLNMTEKIREKKGDYSD